MNKRALIEKAPLEALLTDVAAREKAAKDLHDQRVATVLGEIRRDLDAAIADAERPPEEISVEEEAARAGVTVWAIYKRRQRQRQRAGRAA